MTEKDNNPYAYEIKLSEDEGETEADISVVQLLRAGKFKYFDGSTLDITEEVLLNMKRNFDNKVKKCDLAIDYFHASHQEAAGWIEDVILKNNNTELWVKVNWTERAREKILSKEIRYLSVDFEWNYKDNENPELEYGATLNGGGLTNRPFVKGMNPVLHDFIAKFDKTENPNDYRCNDLENNSKQTTKEKENKKMIDFTEIKKEVVVMSDSQKKELGSLLGIEHADVKLAEKNAALEAQVVTLSAQVESAKKEAEFSVLMSEGKACPAQKAAYMSGNMAEFVKLSVPVNFEGKGSGNPKLDDKEPEVKSAEEAELKVSKLAEAKRKADVKLSVAESVNMVLREQPELAKFMA